jgi:hypothetical protein
LYVSLVLHYFMFFKYRSSGYLHSSCL